MTKGIKPRSQKAHAHVKNLRDELYRIRAEKPGSGYALDAYIRYMRESSRLGLNPTSLPEHSPIEEDRFFSRVVEGPDGHRYWQLVMATFKRNDGHDQHPRRWWWEHEHDVQLERTQDVVPMCGDKKCITPAHCQVGRELARRIYSDQHMLGGLQVEAMRLGRPPTQADWKRSGRKPSPTAFDLRFGSWNKALIAAGLDPNPQGVRPK